MQTIPSSPTRADSPAEAPANGGPPPPPPAAPPGGIGAGAFAVVAAVMALVIACLAVVFVGDRTSSGGGAGSGGGTPTVALSEFALTPSTITVPAGGKVKVTNEGSSAHNLSVTGTDLATPFLAPGKSATLDLSLLDPGDYEMICAIPGHADQGMKGTLTIGAGGSSSGAPAGAGAATGGAGTGPKSHMSAKDYAHMSEAMNKTIAQFPAATAGHGNQVLRPKVLAGGIKRFDLTAAVTPWEVEPGKKVDAWTYNGMVPGPQIRVKVGDRVRIVLHNELPMATDLHLHGINVDNSMDGVAPITQPLVKPGKSFTYEFVADEPAVAMYHSHHHAQLQVPNGMLGTIFVGEVALPTGLTVSGHPIPAGLKLAQEMPMVLNDSGAVGYSLNGKSFPATEPITAHVGDWILVHYVNEGGQIHPMHLHQFDQIVVAKDGFPLDSPYVADTVTVAPGERYSVLIHLDKAGTWVWHCHILNHVERDEGMYGMVTAVVVR